MENSQKESLNVLQTGMDLDNHPSKISENSYTLLVNGNIQGNSGDFVMIQNEPSNLLCSNFKPGFLVIGQLYIPEQTRTIYFLVNPQTLESEIGFINNISYNDVQDRSTHCKECDTPLVPDTPLEQTTQYPNCIYQTIINSSCLNFNINNPVRAVYSIGYSPRDNEPMPFTVIYFTDNLNPRRYLELENIPYTVLGFDINNCNLPIYSQTLDCNQILVSSLFNPPCINALDIIIGGSLKGGTYQFTTCYATNLGVPITNYSTVTNPVSIFDSQQTITINTDYVTNQAIKLQVNNLESTEFRYVNLVVIQTINQISTVYLIGTFFINSSTFSYTHTGNNYSSYIQLSIDDILTIAPIYNLAKGVATANQFLFWNGLTEQRVVNLQSVVNNLTLKWQTVETDEGFYANGINSANSTGYCRDEVYPFGIDFQFTNGYVTPTFLIPGPSRDYFITDYNTDPYTQIDTTNPDVLNSGGCDTTSLNQLWQVYNTATNLGITCGYNAPSSSTGTYTQTEYCTSANYNNTSDGGTGPISCFAGAIIYGSPTLVTPTSTITINNYNPNPTIYQPNWTNDINSLYQVSCPSGCSQYPLPANPPLCCLQGSNGYIPTNTTALSSYTLYPSINTTCSQDVNAGNQSFRPLVYFSNKTSPNTPLIGNCSGGDTSNQIWFQFTAISNVQAITVSPYVPVPVTIIAYSDLGLTSIGCDSGSVGGYLVLQNLVIGQIYYFVVFTPDPTFSTAPVPYTGLQWLWGTICLNTPIIVSTSIKTIPAVYNQVYQYTTTVSGITSTSSSCYQQTYQYGDFSYWESSLTYPNNPDVWGNLCGQKLRYHKFPDLLVSPKQDNPLTNNFGLTNKIYPIGVRLDVRQIKQVLNQAVAQGLLNENELTQIVGYSIKRGNRRNNKSVIAKGLLTDVWSTPQLQQNTSLKNPTWQPIVINGQAQLAYYPNYMFNDSNPDPFLLSHQNGPLITHPYTNQNKINGRYTFHSPNTSFDQPFVIPGQELKLETVEYGQCKGGFNELLYHDKYVLLSKAAYTLAEILAQAQILLEASLAASSAGAGPGVLGTTPGSIITYAIELAINEVFGVLAYSGKYTQEWAELFQSFGTPQNPVIYYVGLGKYSHYNNVLNNPSSLTTLARKRASLVNSQYLLGGNYEFVENNQTIRFNNFERESSVYLSIDAFDNSNNILTTQAFQNPSNIYSEFTNPPDNSRQSAYKSYSTNCSVNALHYGNIASYYASIKNFVPDQYGTPDQIEWIDTGYCGTIDWNDFNQNTTCDTIFGGDTYLNRFGYKEKMPLFIQDRVTNLTTIVQSDVFYRDLSNIGFANYYFNSMYDDQTNAAAAFFGYTPPATNFLCQNNSFFYQRGTMPWAFYGINYIICESDYNLDLRHAENQLAKNFYPYVGDIVNWTQQYHVSINTDNYYFYNIDYSKQNKENPYYMLRNDFENKNDIFQSEFPNRVVYSVQQVPNWLSYPANNFYDFPLEDGPLTAINETEQGAVVARQTLSTKVYNAFITQQSSLQEIQVSIGNMFATKPREYYKSDLGFGGSNHTAFESTPYGHFFVNSLNPGIFQLGGNQLRDITKGNEGRQKVRSWFRNNLPFNITKDFPTIDIDNNYQYFGIATTWDNKFDRVFFTKRDAQLLPQYKGQVNYDGQYFTYNGIQILPTNLQYFCNKSWTIAYSPILGEFLSFYSFHPNYYLSTPDYFQSGINYPNIVTDNSGLYSHLLTDRSYCCFYGKLEPFIFEYVTTDKYQTSTLEYISYKAEFRRYQEDHTYAINPLVTYNNALIYTNNQSTGNLNLVIKEKDNSYQSMIYPILNGFSTSILCENIEDTFSFNQFEDISLQNNNPIMTYTCGLPYTIQNNNAITMTPKYLSMQLRNDWFKIRLESNQSNYQVVHRYGLNQQTPSKI